MSTPAAAAPAAAAKPDDRIGRSLIGKIEGPTVITDPAQFPKTFKEAPELAELVKQGKLPPVQDRIGQDPLVVKPVHETGKYGGMWRRGFTGPADVTGGIRVMGGPDFLLYVDYTGTKIVPNIARDYKVSDDGRVTALYLRRGMRWSDGHPFTADDFVFWFEDVYQNKELNPQPAAVMSINGKPGAIVKVDEYTVEYRFPDPYYLFPTFIAYNSAVSGQVTQGRYALGSYMPAHYLKQFLPKYAGQDKVNQLAKEAGADTWVIFFKNKASAHLTPELPTVAPWKTVITVNKPTWTHERNPYSIWVDTDGNQLPYIDKIQFTLAENIEIANLRAIAGEYDLQARHMDIGKLPVFVENQQKGDYKVSINPMATGSDYGIWFNLAFDADPEIAEWLNNIDFRHAVSYGINRDQVNEAFFLGVGTPGSCAPVETSIHGPGPEWRTKWCTYDPKQSNELLDKIGLDKKDAEGFRLRTDGKGRLTFEIQTLGGQFVQYTGISEMVRQQWQKIGIDLRVNELERSLQLKRAQANDVQMTAYSNEGSDTLFLASGWVFPVDQTASWYSVEYGKWFQSNGKVGKEPPAPMKEVMSLWRSAFSAPEAEQVKIGKHIWEIVCDTQWYIGVVGQSGAVEGIQIAKNNLGNVPTGYANINLTWPPSISRPATFYWKS